MLVGGILVAVALAGLAAVLWTRRRSHDDEHSVQGYHRQLHTLEHITHPVAGNGGVVAGVADGSGGDSAGAGTGAAVRPSYPESAVRLAGTATVRTPEPPPPAIPPPVVPAKVAGSTTNIGSINSTSSTKVTFDDAPPVVPTTPSSGLFRRQDRAMDAMNRRPRRLAAPALAVASVTVLIVVLILAGSHKVPPPASSSGSNRTQGHGHHPTTPSTRHRSTTRGHSRATTTTTTTPIVSLPSATSTHAANYEVAHSAFTLAFGATTAPCWVNVVNQSSNTTIFSGVLAAGQQRSFPVTGPVSLEVGAPSVFAGSIDGTAFVLPYGFQTPFTLNFVPVAGSST